MAGEVVRVRGQALRLVAITALFSTMAPHPDRSLRWPLGLFVGAIPLAWASTAAAWDWSRAWEVYKDKPEVFTPLLTLLTILVAGTAAWAALGQLRTARRRHEAQTEADRRRHEAQTEADFQRRITESFLKAVEQLGSDKMPVRVGGIYSLERIAKESRSDYWTVMETLTAFVRQQARWKEGDPAPGGPPTDISAVIAVIKRRSAENREREKVEGWKLDLELTDLRKADLRDAHLERADLGGAHLEGADLWCAHLERADLREADLGGARLEGAYLGGAHLERADLREAYLGGAHLERADLREAGLGGARLGGADLGGARLEGTDLREADLGGAHLEGASLLGARLDGTDITGAHLKGASLGGATGLTQEMLDLAFGDASTTSLPEGLTRPVQWSATKPAAATNKA